MKEYRSGQQSNAGKSRSGAASSADRQASALHRPFAVFDIDGTLIRWQLYHAIADALHRLGYIDSETFQSVKDARMQWKRRVHTESFKYYEHTLVKHIDEVMTGLTFTQYSDAIDSVFNEYKDQAYTYSRDLISKLKKEGYVLLAISGSQQEIVARIANHYGFDDYIGSEYPRKGAGFSGKKIVRSVNKHLVLEKLIKKHGLTISKSVGVGDSASDISMLEMVETPIAFNPEIKLFNHAKKKGWKIIVERKNIVVELVKKNGQYILA